MLDDLLKDIAKSIDALKDEAKQVLADAVITDEHLDSALEWSFTRDRYLLIRPDGKSIYGFPYPTHYQTSFVQKPAAIKTARMLINMGYPTRIYDKREDKFIEVN